MEYPSRKSVRLVGLAFFGLVLAGCQQAAPPAVVVNPNTGNTTEKSTTTETKQVETPVPDGTIQTKTTEQKTTTTEKKQ